MKIYKYFLIPLLISIITIGSISCDSSLKTEQGHDHEEGAHDHSHEEELNDNEVAFSDQQAARVGLTIEEVTPQPFHEIIKTSGQLLAPVGEESTIVATSAGILSYSNISLTAGSNIKQGQAIAVISSQHIAEGDPVQKSLFQYETAKKEFERAEILVKDTLISMTEYNQAKLNYENAKITYDALASTFTAKGVRLNSSITGYIKNISANDGDYVSVGQPIMTVSKNRKIQLKADVSQEKSGIISQIVSANFTTADGKNSYPLDELNGRMVSYGKQLDATSFYVPVIFEFNNTGHFLTGSFVTVYLKTKQLDNAITVPLSALIEEQGLYFVYVKDREHVFRKQEIKKGADDGLRTLVYSGITPGEKVVSNGAYHLKLASMSSAIPHGHSH